LVGVLSFFSGADRLASPHRGTTRPPPRHFFFPPPIETEVNLGPVFPGSFSPSLSLKRFDVAASHLLLKCIFLPLFGVLSLFRDHRIPMLTTPPPPFLFIAWEVLFGLFPGWCVVPARPLRFFFSDLFFPPKRSIRRQSLRGFFLEVLYIPFFFFSPFRFMRFFPRRFSPLTVQLFCLAGSDRPTSLRFLGLFFISFLLLFLTFFAFPHSQGRRSVRPHERGGFFPGQPHGALRARLSRRRSPTCYLFIHELALFNPTISPLASPPVFTHLSLQL